MVEITEDFDDLDNFQPDTELTTEVESTGTNDELADSSALITTGDENQRSIVPFINKNQTDLELVILTNKRAARQDIDNPVAFYNLGSAYFYQNSYQDAISCFNRAIKLKYDYDRAYNNLGAVYDRLGQTYRAFNAYRQALKFNPDLALAHYNIGRLYEKRQDLSSAQTAYETTIQLAPELYQAHYQLAGIHRQKIQSQSMSEDHGAVERDDDGLAKTALALESYQQV